MSKREIRPGKDSQMVALRKELENANEAKVAATERATTAEKKLDEAKDKVAELQAAKITAERRADMAEKKLTEAEKKLAEVTSKVDQLQKELDKALAANAAKVTGKPATRAHGASLPDFSLLNNDERADVMSKLDAAEKISQAIRETTETAANRGDMYARLLG